MISTLQFSSVTQLCSTLCDSMDRSMPGFPVHHGLLELAQTHVHRVGDAITNHLILCCSLLLLPSVFPRIRVFSNKSVLRIAWPKYWSLSISPSNEYSRLISFSIDWFDLFSFLQTASICYSHTSVHMKYFIIAATRVRLCGPQRPRCDSAAS